MNLLKFSVLVFVVGVSLFTSAQAATLSDAQRAQIDQYLTAHSLNPYGDQKGTCYPGGTPLFDMHTGRTMDRHEFVLRKFPSILEGIVTTLPFDGVAQAASAMRPSIVNDFDPSRVADRIMDEASRAEEASQQLVEQLRVAIDGRDFKAVHVIFSRLATLPGDQLQSFGSVLKDARRLLNGACIQEIAVSTQIRDLLLELDAIEVRLNA